LGTGFSGWLSTFEQSNERWFYQVVSQPRGREHTFNTYFPTSNDAEECEAKITASVPYQATETILLGGGREMVTRKRNRLLEQ